VAAAVVQFFIYVWSSTASVQLFKIKNHSDKFQLQPYLPIDSFLNTKPETG
jgi:hypothetical protein